MKTMDGVWASPTLLSSIVSQPPNDHRQSKSGTIKGNNDQECGPNDHYKDPGSGENLQPQERKELATLLIDTLATGPSDTQAKTGAEIVAVLEAMEPIEFVDPDIEDPVAWVKTQRRK